MQQSKQPIYLKAVICWLAVLCTEVDADYVKTSSGFGFVKQTNGDYNYLGATLPVLELMKKSLGPKVKVKAAGGVRTPDQLLAVQAVGCNRCGATATITMMEDATDCLGK